MADDDMNFTHLT